MGFSWSIGLPCTLLQDLVEAGRGCCLVWWWPDIAVGPQGQLLGGKVGWEVGS